jgi:intergrase/recombinase
LKILTSDECPKKHPFDFTKQQMTKIQNLFPFFRQQNLFLQNTTDQVSRKLQTYNSKKLEVPIEVIKEAFIRIMGLDKQSQEGKDLIKNIIERLDRKAEDRISWREFMKFLDYEGLIREEVNNA